jgi:transcriptional regulator with XRE-family HTH domain
MSYFGSNNNNKLGELLMSAGKVQAQVRKSLGLRQVEVAKEAGIDRSRLSLIENEWISPRTDELARIRGAIQRLAERNYQKGAE